MHPQGCQCKSQAPSDQLATVMGCTQARANYSSITDGHAHRTGIVIIAGGPPMVERTMQGGSKAMSMG